MALCPGCHHKVDGFNRVLLAALLENPEMLDSSWELNSSDRREQVAAALGGPLHEMLPVLYERNDGNMSAILREVNSEVLLAEVSRPTLYEWCREIGLIDTAD